MFISLVTASGCFWHLQGGYAQPTPLVAPGGGLAELSVGLGDLRSKPTTVLPEHLSLDVVGHSTTAGRRLGLGVSAAWVPLAGWARDWSPSVRLGLRGLQLEWLPAVAPSGSVSGVFEVGLLFFPAHGTRSRWSWTVALSGEGFLRYGLPLPPGFQLALLVGVGFGNSIGPTS